MSIATKMIRAVTNISKRLTQTLASTHDPVQDKAMNEMCILVNENDEAIGHATKRVCHFVSSNDLILHRAFSVLLFNSKNELLVQKRSSMKITYPGLLSNSCCSHPLHDIECERETKNAVGVKLAAQRRLNFELGIPIKEIDINSMHYVKRIYYKSYGDGVWGEHEIDYILIIQNDVSLNPNPDEVSDVRYVSKNQLENISCEPQVILTPWFKYLVESGMINQWWENIHQLDKITDVENIHRISRVL